MMDITWFVGIGGISLVAILQHIKIDADSHLDKSILKECRAENKSMERISQNAKKEAYDYLHELENLRAAHAVLKQEKACLELAPPPKYKEDLQQPIFQKIFKKGRRALLLETHPDHGGTREAMEEVEAAFEVLKEIKPVVEKKSFPSYESLIRMQQTGLGGLAQQDGWARQFSAHSPFGYRGY